MSVINISVISDEIGGEIESIKGGPASISSRVSEKITDGLRNIGVDKESLKKCIQDAVSLVQTIKDQTASSEDVYPDSISLQLGITSGGTVGFLGSGVGVKVGTTISLTLKFAHE